MSLSFPPTHCELNLNTETFISSALCSFLIHSQELSSPLYILTSGVSQYLGLHTHHLQHVVVEEQTQQRDAMKRSSEWCALRLDCILCTVHSVAQHCYSINHHSAEPNVYLEKMKIKSLQDPR